MAQGKRFEDELTVFRVADAESLLAPIKGFKLFEEAVVTIIPSTKRAQRKLEKVRNMALEPYGKVRRRKGAADITVGGEKKASESSAVERRAFRPDARARAVLRGVQLAQKDLRAAGGAYDLEEARALLHGVSRQAISKRVKEGSLLAVPGPSNRRRYPACQFKSDGSLVEGLQEVRDALPSGNPWVMLNFLVNPDPRLQNRRPIDLLKDGQVDLVVESARRMAEQGA